MNRYETVTIFDADTAEDDRKAILERIEALISGQGALLDFDHWGGRKLAYPIRKKNQGYYVRIDYCGDGELIDAIERMLRHDVRVLRFMTIRLDIDVDPDKLKAAMTETEEEASTPEETETAETATETESEETESKEE